MSLMKATALASVVFHGMQADVYPLTNVTRTSVLMEWWRGERKLTVECFAHGAVEVTRVWGSSMTHMVLERVDVTKNDLNDHWKWLTETSIS